jgi:hypothetical protein
VNADPNICDALVLAQKVAELVEARGGTAADVRAELEEAWLEFAYLHDPGGRQTMIKRAPESGEVQLVAELEQCRESLLQTEADAAAKVGAARCKVTSAQSRLDEHRIGQLTEHAQAWRAHAEDLRRQAEATDALETVVVSVQTTAGGLGDSFEPEPRLRFRRTVLGEMAAAADQYAAWIEGYLLRGRDGLDSETLARMAGELEMPEPAEPVAA